MTRGERQQRLFLDAGVIIEGCVSPWGASKGVLILATQQRQRIILVLAEAIEREIQQAVMDALERLSAQKAQAFAADLAGWLARVRIERWPLPEPQEIQQQKPILLPALRHVNDLAAVVTALQARPDWVISSNRAHWNEDLASRTGLHIVTPQTFMSDAVRVLGATR